MKEFRISEGGGRFEDEEEMELRKCGKVGIWQNVGERMIEDLERGKKSRRNLADRRLNSGKTEYWGKM